jgi:hypothetical protein
VKKAPSKRKTTRRLSSTERAVRDLVALAVGDLSFAHPAIGTKVVLERDGLHVQLDSFERETGEASTVDIRTDLPPLLISRDHATDWIYGCVREAWVHELNEALFVDGARRHDLHNDRSQPIRPPDEAARHDLTAFKMQLAAFLMGGPR